MKTVVPLRIVVRTASRPGPNGTSESVFDYPPWDQIPAEDREHLSFPALVNASGGVAVYDTASWIGQSDAENPDSQSVHLVALVPERFAAAAVRAFPDRCAVLDAAGFTRFYERRGPQREAPEVRSNERAVARLRERYGTLKPDHRWSEADRKAVDPDDPAPGLHRNRMKTAEGLLRELSLTLDGEAVERIEKERLGTAAKR